jgi:hypothetical protein
MFFLLLLKHLAFKFLEPGQVACTRPTHSVEIRGLVTLTTDKFSLFYKISLVK